MSIAAAPRGPLPMSSGRGDTPGRADPRTEYVSGGRWWGAYCYETLANHTRKLLALRGREARSAMMLDPTVRSSVTTLLAAVLADGVQFAPAVQPDADEDGVVAPEERSEADSAAEVAAFCDRAVGGIQGDFEDFLRRWIAAAFVDGTGLAEQVYRLAGPGPDDGQLVLDRIKVKDRDAWNFAVDPAGNVVGVAASRVAGPDGPELLPRPKFAVFAPFAFGDSPEGESLLDAAYNAWNFKTLAVPQYWKYISRFAVPSVFGTTAEDAQPVPEVDAEGVETGRTISPQVAMKVALEALENASVAVAGYGATLQVLNPAGDGAAFITCFDECRREIVYAILQQVRATLEAQHSSKSDSETAQDVLGLFVRLLKKLLADAIRRDILMPLVRYRWGDALAARLTPLVTLGMVEHQDFGSRLNAIARAFGSGLFTLPERPQLVRFIGFRPVEGAFPARPGAATGPEPDADESPSPSPSP